MMKEDDLAYRETDRCKIYRKYKGDRQNMMLQGYRIKRTTRYILSTQRKLVNTPEHNQYVLKYKT